MVDLLYLAFQLIPLAYIIGYIYTFITYIIPAFNVALTEIGSLTVLQLILGFFYFFPGLGLFLFCIVFLIGVWHDAF